MFAYLGGTTESPQKMHPGDTEFKQTEGYPMKRLLIAAPAAALALLLAIPAYAANASTSPKDDNPPDSVSVEVATVNGSGCKNGTAHSFVDDDRRSFLVFYENYFA